VVDGIYEEGEAEGVGEEDELLCEWLDAVLEK
jgi:hypothetical protein